MQDVWKKLLTRQTKTGEFLPQDICVRTDATPQQLASKLAHVADTMIGECYHWHRLAQDQCFFGDQGGGAFFKKARVLSKAKSLFRRQAATSRLHLLNEEECATIAQTKQIVYDLLPTFEMWKSLERFDSSWHDGPSAEVLPVAQVAVNALFSRFLDRVASAPVRRVVASHPVEAPTPDHQRS